jgi:hypothetical protein
MKGVVMDGITVVEGSDFAVSILLPSCGEEDSKTCGQTRLAKC